MKKITEVAAALACLTFHSWGATAASSVRGGTDDPSDIRQRLLGGGESGTFLVAEYEDDDSHWSDQNIVVNGRDSSISASRVGGKSQKQTMNIELENGLIYTLANVDPKWTAQGLKSGETPVKLKSGETKIKLGAKWSVSGSMIDLQGGAPEVIEVEEARGKGRQLQTSFSNPRTNGNKTVLAVRVIAGDGSAYNSTAEQLSNYVFGNGVDAANLASQYKSCSYDQLNFMKTEDRGMLNSSSGSTNINNGVVTIKVDTLPSEGDEVMRNAVTNKITELFGAAPNELAGHVMYCLPENAIDGLAYAFVNSWLSVFQNNWCNYLSAQMHEVGHNMGYAHSGEGTAEYDDRSGMMGFSYNINDGPMMCCNGAKSYQSDWYKASTTIISPTQGIASANGESCFYGSLYGIADYDGSSGRTVIIKINDSQSETDWFVNFNRQTGINSGTREGGDQVLITSAGEEGEAYALSSLVAKLGAGGQYTISNFEGSGNDVIISVESTSTDLIARWAQVRIEFGGIACDGTTQPTPSPTPCPEKSLEIVVNTDAYPGETSWALVNDCTGETEKSSSIDLISVYSNPDTNYVGDWCIPEAQYTFTINDSYNDGMCCQYGSGSYQVSYSGVAVASGGEFSSSESTTFGTCVSEPTPPATPPPTDIPTKLPTTPPTFPPTGYPTDPTTPSPTTDEPSGIPSAQPTKIPTKSPTPSPSESPTVRPTEYPTKSPNALTDQPSESPSKDPTPSPTKIPTDQPTGVPSKSPTNNATSPPSSAPTEPPTPYTSSTGQPTISGPAQCSGLSISIDVMTDNYPGETSWTLTNTCTQDMIINKTRGSYTELNKQFSEQFCVDSAEHEFIITDSFGDGICCGHGSGSYKLTWGSGDVVEGGEFENFESKTFGSCGPGFTDSPTKAPTPKPTPSPTTAEPTKSPTTEPTRSPTKSPTKTPTPQPTPQSPPNGPVPCSGMSISIDILTDNYPGETSWLLENTCTNEVTDEITRGEYTEQETLYTEQYCVDHAAYKFEINDSYGDGICCAHGSGSYKVTWGSGEVSEGGQFGNAKVATYGSCSPTSAPTQSPLLNSCASNTRRWKCKRTTGCKWNQGGKYCFSQ